MEKTNRYNSRMKRTGLDYFGIVMMFVLVACSLAIFARLMATKMLTTTNLIIAMVVLLVLNGLHIFVQLPQIGRASCRERV